MILKKRHQAKLNKILLPKILKEESAINFVYNNC